MKIEIAEQAKLYLGKIAAMEMTLKELREDREAKLTGLDPNTPGGRYHMLESLEKWWNDLGPSFASYFKDAMDSLIQDTEEQLNRYRKEIEDL